MGGPKVRVAIAGVGNCASSLCRASSSTATPTRTSSCPGLMHVELGGYHVGDIEFVAAFDVDADKVGLDLGKAIFASINNTIKFADVPDLGVTVQRGPTLDGLGKYYREVVEECAGRAGRRRPGAARRAPTCWSRTSRSARKTRDEYYAKPALDAGCRVRQLHPGVHRLEPRMGEEVRGAPACRSSATTSRARSARPSCTACWPACSKTAASRSTTPTS